MNFSRSTTATRLSTLAIRLVAVTIVMTSGAAAQTVKCSGIKAQDADLQATRIQSWKQLYASYRKFAGCDDGSIAEGYSESVRRLLVTRWNSLPEFSELAANNSGFKKFVLRHIDATLSIDDLSAIRDGAKKRCPAGASGLCMRIRIAAEEALSANGVEPKSQH